MEPVPYASIRREVARVLKELMGVAVHSTRNRMLNMKELQKWTRP